MRATFLHPDFVRGGCGYVVSKIHGENSRRATRNCKPEYGPMTGGLICLLYTLPRAYVLEANTKKPV